MCALSSVKLSCNKQTSCLNLWLEVAISWCQSCACMPCVKCTLNYVCSSSDRQIYSSSSIVMIYQWLLLKMKVVQSLLCHTQLDSFSNCAMVSSVDSFRSSQQSVKVCQWSGHRSETGVWMPTTRIFCQQLRIRAFR